MQICLFLLCPITLRQLGLPCQKRWEIQMVFHSWLLEHGQQLWIWILKEVLKNLWFRYKHYPIILQVKIWNRLMVFQIWISLDTWRTSSKILKSCSHLRTRDQICWSEHTLHTEDSFHILLWNFLESQRKLLMQIGILLKACRYLDRLLLQLRCFQWLG